MNTKTTAQKEIYDLENCKGLHQEEDKTQDECGTDLNEAWWDAVCYPNPHDSDR